MAPCPCPQKAPRGRGKDPLLVSSPPTTPHLQTDVRLQGLNKIKTDSVESSSGPAYKGLTQLSVSAFILSVPLSSSGCTLLMSFESWRRLRTSGEKCRERLKIRTNWHKVGKGEVCEPRGLWGEEPRAAESPQITVRRGFRGN